MMAGRSPAGSRGSGAPASAPDRTTLPGQRERQQRGKAFRQEASRRRGQARTAAGPRPPVRQGIPPPAPGARTPAAATAGPGGRRDRPYPRYRTQIARIASNIAFRPCRQRAAQRQQELETTGGHRSRPPARRGPPRSGPGVAPPATGWRPRPVPAGGRTASDNPWRRRRSARHRPRAARRQITQDAGLDVWPGRPGDRWPPPAGARRASRARRQRTKSRATGARPAAACPRDGVWATVPGPTLALSPARRGSNWLNGR